MVWWLWLLFGLGLLAVEAATPGGFVALFFGIGAIVVGILAAVGVAGPDWLQWLLFSALSIVSLALLRGPLKARLQLKGNAAAVDSLVGEEAVVLEEVAVGAVGKVELRGSMWNARAAGAGPLPKGYRGRVEKVEGLTLWVR
jgi:membrane protein implicated in regulation of membrane protease activity